MPPDATARGDGGHLADGAFCPSLPCTGNLSTPRTTGRGRQDTPERPPRAAQWHTAAHDRRGEAAGLAYLGGELEMDCCFIRKALLHLGPRLSQGTATRDRTSDPHSHTGLRSEISAPSQGDGGSPREPFPTERRSQELSGQGVAGAGETSGNSENQGTCERKVGCSCRMGPDTCVSLSPCLPGAHPCSQMGSAKACWSIKGDSRPPFQGEALRKQKVPHSPARCQASPWGTEDSFSINGLRQLYTHRGEKRTLVPALTPYTGIISRWVTDLDGELVPSKRRPGRSGTSKKGRQRRSGPAAELHRSLEARKALGGAESEPKVSRACGQ